MTFSGPSYMALPHPSEGQPSSIGPSDTAVAVHEQDKFLTNAPSRPWQTTGLAPLAPHEIAVASTLSIPERVALSVSTWIDYQRHRQLRPTRAQMSSHAIKRAEKEEANENRRLKWQRKGITTRSRFLSDKPMHLRTKSGKSSIGFKRAQRKRRQSRSGPRRR